ncbi:MULTISPECIES: hypothetical protein [Cupriavidus]
MLESLGLEVGRHLPQAGVFHVRADATAKQALDELQADFAATLLLRENDHELIKPLFSLDVAQHAAEIAFSQYMANALPPPRSGGREYWEYVEGLHRSYVPDDAQGIPAARNEPAPDMVLYSAASKTIVAVLNDDGTSPASHVKVQRVRERHPDAAIMRLDAAERAIDEAYCTAPREISAEDFQASFGCMPPARSALDGGMHTFRLSELYAGNIANWYAKLGERCFTFRGHKDMPTQEVASMVRAHANRMASPDDAQSPA